MDNWYLTVDLADHWSAEDLSFEQRRDGIANLLGMSRWRTLSDNPARFDQLLAGLRKTADIREFDLAFGLLHDLANTDRVWIETH